MGGTSGARNPTTYYNFAVTFSHVRSEHSLRYGGEFRVLQENNYNYGNISPAIDFSSTWTNGPMDNRVVGFDEHGVAGLDEGGHPAQVAHGFADQGERELWRAVHRGAGRDRPPRSGG